MINIKIGQRFNRLKVIKFVGKNHIGHYLWQCICDCGNSTIARGASLKCGYKKSCGCLNKPHGFSKSKFWYVYIGMKERCENFKSTSYERYGGRGIKCLWNSFEEFRDDMYLSYQEHLKQFGKLNTTIDRIDNHGHYSKENCRWATNKEQGRNKRNNILLTFNNETKCLSEWAEILGIKYSVLWDRITISKWSAEKALTTPVKK